MNEQFPDRKQSDAAGGFVTRGSVDVSAQQEIAAETGEKRDPETGEETPEGEEPTEHEKSTLRRVGENLPASAFLIAIVELCERFTYYGCQGLFQNYIQNATDGANGAHGIGLGQQAATGLNLFFQWFCYGKSRASAVTVACTDQPYYSHTNFGRYHR